MKKILLSIKPEFAHAILNGTKKVEFRKRMPLSLNEGCVLIYSSFPEKKIIGEFRFSKILCETPEVLWRMTSRDGGISKNFFDKYFLGKDKAFAFYIDKVTRFENPYDLKDFGVTRAPQSFQYIETTE